MRDLGRSRPLTTAGTSRDFPGQLGLSEQPAGGMCAMDAQTRREIAVAVQAVDDALTGLVGFLMTLRPTLRNEILQICGRHMDRAR